MFYWGRWNSCSYFSAVWQTVKCYLLATRRWYLLTYIGPINECVCFCWFLNLYYILLFALNGIALGLPSLTWRTDLRFAICYWNTENEDFFFKGKIQQFWTWAWLLSPAHLSQQCDVVQGLPMCRTESVWNNISSVFWFKINVGSVMVVRACSAAQVMLVLIVADCNLQQRPAVFLFSSDCRRHSLFSCVASKLPGV